MKSLIVLLIGIMSGYFTCSAIGKAPDSFYKAKKIAATILKTTKKLFIVAVNLTRKGK